MDELAGHRDVELCPLNQTRHFSHEDQSPCLALAGQCTPRTGPLTSFCILIFCILSESDHIFGSTTGSVSRQHGLFTHPCPRLP